MSHLLKKVKDVRQPKKRHKLYIVQCSKCKHKAMVELRRQQKTMKHNCSSCKETSRMKITGKIVKVFVRWNSMRIRYF